MIKVSHFVLVLSLICLLFAGSAMAQPCIPNHPVSPQYIVYGQSYCFKVCAYEGLFSLFMVGVNPDPNAVPQLIFQRGCAVEETNCNDVCNPIDDVPTTVTSDSNTYVNPHRIEYHMVSNCLDITYYRDHDQYWVIEIDAMCSGCFCLTYDSQLSVELTSFTAESSSDNISLHWSTASETRSAEWLIQRSDAEQGDFALVDRIAAAGTSTSPRNYSWADYNVQAGRVYYYRLAEKDVNGEVTNVGSVVHAELTSSQLPQEYALEQNFPNPFNPSTEIAFTMKETGFMTLKVYNMIGQEVATLINREIPQGRHVVTFDASHLPSALYLYKMETNNFTAVNKMLLMK